MKTSRLSATLVTSVVTLLALSAASPNCSAQDPDDLPQDSDVYFISNGDFNLAANWDNVLMPSLLPNPALGRPNVYGIDDGLSATFSGGTTTVLGLRVGSGSKFHTVGEIHFGRLTMEGGTLEVVGNASKGAFVIGRERLGSYPIGGDYNQNTVVDAADYVIWRDTVGLLSDLRADGDDSGLIDALDYEWWRARYGNVQNGGKIEMTGMSTVRANGMIIGERTKGELLVGPDAVVELRDWVTTVEEPVYHFGGSQDMRIGLYGPAYEVNGELGRDGDGLVDVQGTLKANALFVSVNGGKGEILLSGRTVNLNGALIMSFCEGCYVLPAPSHPDYPIISAWLALQSSKVSIDGSSGTFNVGLDPDPVTPDPNLIIDAPFSRDIRFNYEGGPFGHPTTATFSFTADAGGVTRITVVDNGLDSSGTANLSGTAYIAGAKLELNLDAYTSASPLTLIDAPADLPGAPPAHLVGVFGTVTFLGSRTATVNYDYVNGNVFLNNFQNGAGAGSLAGVAVPEPSGLIMIVTLGLFLILFGAGANRQRARRRGYQCLKIRA